jgi:hypothetical protein
MSTYNTTHIPVDDQYVALVGKAVYTFAYYEWTIIWIIECLKRGFVVTYSREKSLSSGLVKEEFQGIVDILPTDLSEISQQDLQVCCDTFNQLISKRNALIHAHPCTDINGAQILTYQGKLSKSLPDMKWSMEEVEKIISEIDVAACNAGVILDKIRYLLKP